VLFADREPKSKGSKYEAHLTLIKDLFDRCQGNVVRLQECLEHEYSIKIPYTFLTWMVRTFEIKEPQKNRSGQYVFGPGEEMQHDTSPFKILLGETEKGCTVRKPGPGLQPEDLYPVLSPLYPL
jgi:hypothetical protein